MADENWDGVPLPLIPDDELQQDMSAVETLQLLQSRVDDIRYLFNVSKGDLARRALYTLYFKRSFISSHYAQELYKAFMNDLAAGVVPKNPYGKLARMFVMMAHVPTDIVEAMLLKRERSFSEIGAHFLLNLVLGSIHDSTRSEFEVLMSMMQFMGGTTANASFYERDYDSVFESKEMGRPIDAQLYNQQTDVRDLPYRIPKVSTLYDYDYAEVVRCLSNVAQLLTQMKVVKAHEHSYYMCYRMHIQYLGAVLKEIESERPHRERRGRHVEQEDKLIMTILWLLTDQSAPRMKGTKLETTTVSRMLLREVGATPRQSRIPSSAPETSRFPEFKRNISELLFTEAVDANSVRSAERHILITFITLLYGNHMCSDLKPSFFVTFAYDKVRSGLQNYTLSDIRYWNPSYIVLRFDIAFPGTNCEEIMNAEDDAFIEIMLKRFRDNERGRRDFREDEKIFISESVMLRSMHEATVDIVSPTY